VQSSSTLYKTLKHSAQLYHILHNSTQCDKLAHNSIQLYRTLHNFYTTIENTHIYKTLHNYTILYTTIQYSTTIWQHFTTLQKTNTKLYTFSQHFRHLLHHFTIFTERYITLQKLCTTWFFINLYTTFYETSPHSTQLNTTVHNSTQLFTLYTTIHNLTKLYTFCLHTWHHFFFYSFHTIVQKKLAQHTQRSYNNVNSFYKLYNTYTHFSTTIQIFT